MPSTITAPRAVMLPVGHWTMREWWEQVERCLDAVPEDPAVFLEREAAALLAECERSGNLPIKVAGPSAGLADSLAFAETALMRCYPAQS